MTGKGPVKVGIIGSRFEGDIHAASFQMVPEAAEVVAIASPTAGCGEATKRKHAVDTTKHMRIMRGDNVALTRLPMAPLISCTPRSAAHCGP